MGLYDSTLVPAVDTVEVQAGGTGLPGFDNADVAVGRVTAATISGLGSIYNTFAAGTNYLGGDMDSIDTYKKLEDIDLSWAKDYKEHQNAIDVAGFIGASLIPGTLGIKALNATRAGFAGNAIGKALGFAKSGQARALDAALTELTAEGGTVFTQISRNKLAAMAWGVADQTLTAAAFETAVAATMKQSPMLADDSWWDIGKTALIGSVFGGVVGGGIDSILLNNSFKNAVKGIDSKLRTYDYQKVYEGLDISKGDATYGILDSLLKLPTEVLAEDATFGVRLHSLAPEKSTFFNPATGKLDIPVDKILGGALKQTERNSLLDFELNIRKLSTAGDVSAPVADMLLKKYAALKTAGASVENIRDDIGSYLRNLQGVRAATEEPLIASSDLWYFKKSLSMEEIGKIKTLDDWEAAVKSTTPMDNNAYKYPYVFTGTTEQRLQAFSEVAKIGTKEGEYVNISRAWEDGKHVAILPDGTFRVNDASPLWKRVDDPAYSPSRYLNTRTGAVTGDTVLTAADRLPAGKMLDIKPDAVYSDGKVISMKTFNENGDTQYFTARHAWASKLEDAKLPETVRIDDFSLMDRLRTVPEDLLDNINITTGKGEVLFKASEVSIPDVIKSAKLSEAQRLLADSFDAGVSLDARALGYRLNVDAQWLENTVATRFSESFAGKLDINNKVIDPKQGLSLPLGSYTRRENVVANYATPQQFRELDTLSPKMTWQEKRQAIMDSVGNNGGQFVTGDLDWSYRVKAAIQATQNASTAVLGPQRAALLLNLEQNAATLADSTGVGAKFLSSSNADYGDVLKLWSQTTGKNAHLWIQEDGKAVIDALSSHVSLLRNSPKDAAELGIIVNMLRGTPEKYIFNPANPKQLILRELLPLQADAAKYNAAIGSATSAGRKAVIDINSDLATDFLTTHTALNADRINKRIVLANARGFQSTIQPDTVYVPPIDTSYFKHFAFVRPVEGKAFSTSEVSMVFGRDAAELNKRIASVDSQNFDVITKDQTVKFFKAKDAYDFDRTINEGQINNELRRSGALTNFQPEVRAENLTEDFLRWHQNQAATLVRDSIETNYAQQIAELRKLGESYTSIATSKFSGTLTGGKRSILDPYDDYVKTALDVSKQSEYTFFHQANEFVDALGTRAYRAAQNAFGDASKGIVTWTEANAIAEKHGVGSIYNNATEFFTANAPRDRNLVREYVSKANGLLSNLVLRFDFINPIINTISTPILLGTELTSIRNLISKDSELTGKLNELLNVAVPGTNGAVGVPSTTKLLYNSVKNFFGPGKEELLTRYLANNDVKSDVLFRYHGALEDLAMRADFAPFRAGVERAFDKMGQITGNNWAEQFTRFVSADVMRQLTDPLVGAGKLALAEQNAYISTFVNRVQGNYISSQRPIVFQGVLGSAVGLFQTYQFNMLQQILRHVENGDKKALATLFGLQSSLYGLNGTPMFDAINTHLIGNANINTGHYDAYSVAPQLFNKEIGDWMLYGTASAMPGFGGKWPAVYSRGDINPRNVTILPINPADIPAIDASIRVVKNLLTVGEKLAGGAAVGQTLLQGLEHNALSRPLAGMAQVMAGQATTGKGALISASSDFGLIANAARIAGAKPLDEAIALNNMYRVKAYQVADRDRMEFLGEKVKSYLYNNTFPPDEVMNGFMKDYASAGGRVENFNGTMQHWMKDANVSTVEKLRSKLNSSYGQRLNDIMGGTGLTDYRSQSAVATPENFGLIPE